MTSWGMRSGRDRETSTPASSCRTQLEKHNLHRNSDSQGLLPLCSHQDCYVTQGQLVLTQHLFEWMPQAIAGWVIEGKKTQSSNGVV